MTRPTLRVRLLSAYDQNTFVRLYPDEWPKGLPLIRVRDYDDKTLEFDVAYFVSPRADGAIAVAVPRLAAPEEADET